VGVRKYADGVQGHEIRNKAVIDIVMESATTYNHDDVLYRQT